MKEEKIKKKMKLIPSNFFYLTEIVNCCYFAEWGRRSRQKERWLDKRVGKCFGKFAAYEPF